MAGPEDHVEALLDLPETYGGLFAASCWAARQSRFTGHQIANIIWHYLDTREVCT